MRRYLTQLEIECFEQTLITSCAGNRESDLFVRNFHTAEFWQPFQRCCAPVHYKRIALLYYACLHPGYRYNTDLYVHGSVELSPWCITSQHDVLSRAQMVQVPHFFLQQLTTVLIANVTRLSPACKRGEEPGTRLHASMHTHVCTHPRNAHTHIMHTPTYAHTHIAYSSIFCFS